MKEFDTGGGEQPKTFTEWPDLQIGEQYERVISYVDGESSTQVFTYNGTVVGASGKVELDITYDWPHDLHITKHVSPETIGLSGPIKDSEILREVRPLLPPDQR